MRFIGGGKAFSFVVKDYGRYYDVPTALVALNAALDSLGSDWRFFQFHATGQIAVGVFAPQEAFGQLVEDLALPIQELTE